MATILIVEDDPYVRNFYDRLFRIGSSHKVVMAGSGEEGLKLAKEQKPDLVLLDIMMPGMNGLEVLEKLKAETETKDLTVVILTNFGEEEFVKKAVALGATSFIVKSEIEGEQLLKLVDKYIADQGSKN